MEALQNIPYEKLIESVTKYSKENQAIVGASAAAAILGSILVFRRREMSRDGTDYNSNSGTMKLLRGEDHTLGENGFRDSINDYETMFDGARKEHGAITSEESIEVRKQRYAAMVDHFYNIVTDFYEYGWGQSFHFAPRFKTETFNESLIRAEHHLANRLGLRPGMKVLDVGCGVGGPLRNMIRFSGAHVTGITINQYQVNIGNKYCKAMGLANLGVMVQGDFQNLPFEPETFDCAYQIEATCHSPDRVRTFSQIARVLKPGGLFCGYEWVVTPNYDPKNVDHVRIKEGIEVGNALPTLVYGEEIIRCMEAAGFEMIDAYDANRGQHNANEIPWYDTLCGTYSVSGFRMTHLGRVCTHTLVWILETIRIAPPGSTKISALLNATAIDLVEGGKEAIFTPSFFFIGKKK